MVPETTKAFLKLLVKKPEEINVGFIATASYADHPKGDAVYIKEDKQRLNELGFKAIMEIDLREEKGASLREKMGAIDLIFVSGGNTFYLMEYIRESGFDKVLGAFLDKGGIYVGVSAGSIIAGRDIAVSGWDPDWDINTVGLEDMQGLGLVDFIISPHYAPEEDAVINEDKGKVSCPIFALTDSQAILVEEGNVKFIGPGEFKKF